jgi:hydrogenase maturation protease
MSSPAAETTGVDPSRRPLVIGFGNDLLGDDGAGPALARRVARHAGEGVETIVAMQLLPEHAVPIADASLVVFADAALDVPAGAFVCEWIEPAATPSRGMHRFEPADLLTLARDSFGRCPAALLVRIGIVGGACEMGTSPGRDVRRAVREAAARVLLELSVHRPPAAAAPQS